MLTVTTRQIFDRSSEGSFVAHVIRIPTDAPNTFTYLVGLSYANGSAIGMITSHTGDVLRQWKRVTAIEEYLAVLGDRLVGIFVYPSNNPEPAVMTMLSDQYGIMKPHPDELMETERRNILSALLTRSEDGRVSDTPDS